MEEFDAEGKTSMQDFPLFKFDRFLRNQIARDLENEALLAMKSDEYNFNDTAVRAKTFLLAANRVRNIGN